MESVLKHKKSADNFSESAEVVVDMMRLCNSLDGDYWTIRNQLKQLEWNINEFGKYKSKSGIVVQFTDVSFYVMRRCIINNEELDDINELLWNRVTQQLNFNHNNFNALYKILNDYSYRNISEYIDTISKGAEENDQEFEAASSCVTLEKNVNLKNKLNEYFMNELDLEAFAKTSKVNYVDNPAPENQADINGLIGAINQFIFMYTNEMKITGNIIARIFHGVGTPRYPAEVWGRQRNFWRAHLRVNFEKIVQLAKEQLCNLK